MDTHAPKDFPALSVFYMPSYNLRSFTVSFFCIAGGSITCPISSTVLGCGFTWALIKSYSSKQLSHVKLVFTVALNFSILWSNSSIISRWFILSKMISYHQSLSFLAQLSPLFPKASVFVGALHDLHAQV